MAWSTPLDPSTRFILVTGVNFNLTSSVSRMPLAKMPKRLRVTRPVSNCWE